MILDVTDANFESEVKSHKGICVVDFWAPWCGPCKMIAPVFKQLSEEITNVKFAKINVDDNQKYPSQFAIQSIPTFVIFKDGVEVARKIGGGNKDALSSWIKSIS